MKRLYAHPLTQDERRALRAGLKSNAGFTVRRSQLLLLSADDHLTVTAIGHRLGCTGQAVREAIHAFEQAGLTCLHAKSKARHDDQRALDETARSQLGELIRQSPRQYGYAQSHWTLELLAAVCATQGWTQTRVHKDTISATLRAIGIRWTRAKGWLTSPDPAYKVKKTP